MAVAGAVTASAAAVAAVAVAMARTARRAAVISTARAATLAGERPSSAWVCLALALAVG